MKDLRDKVIRKVAELMMYQEDITCGENHIGSGMFIGEIAVVVPYSNKFNAEFLPRVYVKDIYVDLEKEDARGIWEMLKSEVIKRREHELAMQKHKEEYQKRQERDRQIVEEYLNS